MAGELDIKIGERVRKVRTDRGLTLQDVANYTGFSKALISQIENNVVTPPINTLSKIAKVLNVKMTYFFEEEVDYRDFNVVMKNERKIVFREGIKHGYSYEELARLKSFEPLEPFLVTIKPGRSEKKLFNHEGYEFMYILAGKIRLFLNMETFDLGEGDSIVFNSAIPHYAESLEEPDARIISIRLDTAELKSFVK